MTVLRIVFSYAACTRRHGIGQRRGQASYFTSNHSHQNSLDFESFSSMELAGRSSAGLWDLVLSQTCESAESYAKHKKDAQSRCSEPQFIHTLILRKVLKEGTTQRMACASDSELLVSSSIGTFPRLDGGCGNGPRKSDSRTLRKSSEAGRYLGTLGSHVEIFVSTSIFGRRVRVLSPASSVIMHQVPMQTLP